MEFFDHDGGCERSAAALGFGTADAFGLADHLHVSRCKQPQHALVETEIADRILNLALFDVPKTVTRQAGEQRGSRINATDVPESAHQQTPLHRADHLLETGWLCSTFEDRIHWTRSRFLALFFRPIARVMKVL